MKAWDERRRAAAERRLFEIAVEIEQHRKRDLADFDGREKLYAEYHTLKAMLARSMGCWVLPLAVWFLQ